MSAKLSAAERKGVIVHILASFDRAVASKHFDEALLTSAMEKIVGFDWQDWPHANMRALLEAYATCAPDDALLEMGRAAQKSRKWVEWWDRRGWLESHVCDSRGMSIPELKRTALVRYPNLADEIRFGSAAKRN